ncbi:hypothetical protein [Paenibacillus humicus]|uniref:hypothetical protein n=1 Tax=Paenibacillus humicus TaxID=412861 RepID=UPI003F17DA63
MKGPPLAGWHIGGRLLSSGCLESDGGRSGSPSACQGITGSAGAEESPGAVDAEEAAGVKEAPGAADAEKAAGA